MSAMRVTHVIEGTYSHAKAEAEVRRRYPGASVRIVRTTPRSPNKYVEVEAVVAGLDREVMVLLYEAMMGVV